MSHFYGTLNGSRGEATRCGTKQSGVRTIAASWKGAIQVDLFHHSDGTDRFEIRMIPWENVGEQMLIACGKVGELGGYVAKVREDVSPA